MMTTKPPQQNNRDKRGRYGILFTIFILIMIFVLGYNLISLKKDRIAQKTIRKLYFADNMSDAHLKIIQNFNASHIGEIEVVPINLPFEKFTTNDRKELIARSLRSRSSRIDIFAVDQIWVPRFAKWSEPLVSYFEMAELERIVPQALTTCYYDNALLGIPLYIDVSVLYYRKDLIRETPDYTEILNLLQESISWEDLLEYGQKYFPDRYYYLYQGDKYEGLICNYLEFLGGMGGFWTQDNQWKLNNEKGRNSIQFMVDLVAKYKATPAKVSTFFENESYIYALHNDAPFFRGWSGFLKDMQVNSPDSNKVKYLGVSALPHFDSNLPVTVFGGWNLMISKYSEKKAEAVEFINYLLTEDAQKILFKTSGYLPILNSIYSDSAIVTDYPYIKFLESLMDYGIYRPKLVDYTKISDILSSYLNSVLTQEMTAEEALSQFDERVESDFHFLR